MTTTTAPHPGSNRKKPLLRALGVTVGVLALLVAVVVMYYENVIITTGPSRHDVTSTAERVLRQSTPHLPGHPVLGPATPYYDPCGHGETGPQQADAGIKVRVTGVPAARHKAFENAVTEQTLEHTNTFRTNPGWVGFVYWDSDASSGGTITIGPGCVPVARWP